MPRQKQAAATAVEHFDVELEKALKEFSNPGWLGGNSPLAAPYFLGQYLNEQDKTQTDDVLRRGRALQQLIREAADVMAGEPGSAIGQDARLLDISFFKPRPVQEILALLNISRSTYFNHRKRAIQQLGAVIIQRQRPALGLETLAVPAKLVGRDQVIADCQQYLGQGQSVGLSGPGGIGKTAVGSVVVTQLRQQPFFWFTFRPGLNDRLANLFFALGYFLSLQNAAGLWRQLVADKGEIDLKIAQGLLRQDLLTLQDHPVVLCFDEVDLLKPSEIEAHAQLLAFLRSLNGLSPLIFIGQQLPLETDRHVILDGLPETSLHELLRQHEVAFPTSELSLLVTFTQGNPRILELIIALHKSGNTLEGLLRDLPSSPSIQTLFERIWRRMSETEREMLAALAVYRRAAPRHVWLQDRHQVTLQQLARRSLIQLTQQGGVQVLPAFRGVVYHLLSPESREHYHLSAAMVRREHGDYTAAAYHFIKGAQPALAVRLWYTHQDQEINQGQGQVAFELFRQLSGNPLPVEDQQLLSLLRSRLAKLQSDYETAKQELGSTLWSVPNLKMRAKRIEGDIAELTNHYDEAIRAYSEGLEISQSLYAEARFQREMAEFHGRRGLSYRLEKKLDPAQQEAMLVRYNAALLQGSIEADIGNLTTSQTFYGEAIDIAEALQHRLYEGLARTNLATILSMVEKFDEAENHLKRSYQIFEEIGDKNNLTRTIVNRALNFNLAGDPAAAVPLAEEALHSFIQMEDLFGLATAAQNLAEAHLELDNLALAERHAWQVVQTENVILMPDGLRVLGEIKLQQQNYPEARRFITEAIELTQENKDEFLEGYCWRALCKLYLAEHNQEQANAAATEAIRLFETLALAHEVEKTQQLLVDI